MKVAFARENPDWQGPRLPRGCDSDAATVLNIRPRAERTAEQARRFIDDFEQTFEPDEVDETAADTEHSQRGDQID
jgi:hypothetical protein